MPNYEEYSCRKTFHGLYLWRKVTIIKYAWNVRARGWQCDLPCAVVWTRFADKKCPGNIFSLLMYKNFFKHKQLNVIILNINKYSIAWFDASMLIFHDSVWTRVYEEISFLFKWPQILKMKWNEKYPPYPDKEIRANLLALKRQDFFRANNSFYCTRCGQQRVE